MYIHRPLTKIEKLCIYCNKEINIKKQDFIGNIGKNKIYRLAHKTCHNKYLKYINGG